MAVNLRPVAEEEFEAAIRLFRATFGGSPSREDLERVTGRAEVERTLVGVDDVGVLVATAGAYSFRLQLPGGSDIGCAGICMVAVRGDHRRRGLLTALMDGHLQQARARGEAVAALWASEAPIYGRFGFGPAARTVQITLQRAHAALRPTPGVDTGRALHGDSPVAEVQLIDHALAEEVLPAVHAAATRQRPGAIHRPERFWPATVAPTSGEGPPRQIAWLPGRGYAIHHLEPGWSDAGPTGTVRVEELMATDAQATAALWRFVTDVDLASRTVAGRRPVDDPVLAMLVDPGRAEVGADWPLQLRLVDLATALEARSYAADGRLVLAVADRQLPDQAGSWELHAAAGQATCRRSDAAPDLTMDVEVLGAVYLGGVRTTQLLAAGQLTEHRPGAAARLDRLLAAEVAPWHGFMF